MGTPPKLKLKTQVEPEGELHVRVASLLGKIVRKPAVWACYPAGHIPLPPVWQAKLYRMGLKRSWPDFIIIHGRPYGIELKRIGGKLSHSRYVHSTRGGLRFVEGQKETFGDLEAAGMEIAVCHDCLDVIACLQAWGIPHLNVHLDGGTLGQQSPARGSKAQPAQSPRT